MQSDIIDFQVGLHVAVRSGYQSWYGTFVKITATTATVKLEDGSERKFQRSSRFEIGSEQSKYTRPYICTVAKARDADKKYAELTAKAASDLQRRGVI